MNAAILAFAVLIVSSPAWAHGDAQWIMRGGYKDATGASCCGPQDCSAVPASEVETNRYGYIWRGHFVRGRDALPSTDGQYWACTKPGGIRCLFVPLVG